MQGGQQRTGSNLLKDETGATLSYLQGSDLALHNINGGSG